MKDSWKTKAKALKNDLKALYLAYKDPRIPMYLRVMVWCVIAYALSPIDLIPDFIPVIGHLDDLIIIPLAIILIIKLMPKDILQEYREKVKNS